MGIPLRSWGSRSHRGPLELMSAAPHQQHEEQDDGQRVERAHLQTDGHMGSQQCMPVNLERKRWEGARDRARVASRNGKP